MNQLLAFNLGDTLLGDHPGATKLAGVDISTFISTVLPNALVGASLIFFILILGAGFMMIKSAGGQGTPQDAAKAKAALTYAVIGFLLVIGAFFIMQLLHTITGVDYLKPGI